MRMSDLTKSLYNSALSLKSIHLKTRARNNSDNLFSLVHKQKLVSKFQNIKIIWMLRAEWIQSGLWSNNLKLCYKIGFLDWNVYQLLNLF